MGGSSEITAERKKADYSFDDWREMWDTSPETFEYLRKKHIEAIIGKAPEDQQHRLRCLQWKIDTVRERAANAMAATIEISEMMWDAFSDLGEVYKDLHDTVNGAEPAKRSKSEAKILAFALPE